MDAFDGSDFSAGAASHGPPPRPEGEKSSDTPDSSGEASRSTLAKTKAPTLESLLQAKIFAILEEPLTPKSCNRLLKLVGAIKQLLYVVSDAPPLKRIATMPQSIAMPDGSSITLDEMNDVGPSSFNAETTGTAAVKQVIDAFSAIEAKKHAPRVDQLIDAYQSAKNAGLDDVAAKLKAQIDAQVGIEAPAEVS